MEQACSVGMPGEAVEHLEQTLGLDPLDAGIRHSGCEAQPLAERVRTEVRPVFGQELLDDEVIDLLAFEVPHLLVTAQMREGIERLTHFVLGRGRLVVEERVDVPAHVLIARGTCVSGLSVAVMRRRSRRTTSWTSERRPNCASRTIGGPEIEPVDDRGGIASSVRSRSWRA